MASRNWREWLNGDFSVRFDPLVCDKIGAMVDAVRSCPHLGAGSCSTVECETDEELIADFIEWAVEQVDAADYRHYKRKIERLVADIRNA